MKKSESAAVRKGARRLDAKGLSQVGAGLDSLAQKLPNNQQSEMKDSVPMADVLTYDLRTKKNLTDINGAPVKPVALVIDGRPYKNQVRFGGYRFETPMATTKIVGLTNFGNGLYVQPAPLQPFLRIGQHAVGEYEREHGRIDDRQANGKAQIADIIRGGAIEGGGRNYRNACFEAIQEDSPNKTITVLVLGPQREDGRHENAEAYEELGSGEKKKLSPNIHEFQDMQVVQSNNGELINVRVIHANVSKFDEQHLDSGDLETLATVYADTLGQGNPLTIHCTDGLDRAGGIAFAMHLMKNYESVFVPGNDNATLANVIKEHDYMQDLRGGYFCTANETRLSGAAQLATIMKSIEMSRSILVDIARTDPELHGKLNGKNYVEQVGILLDQDPRSSTAQELLTVLVVRGRAEQRYLNKLAKDIDHPLVVQFQSLEPKIKIVEARGMLKDIDEMIRNGHRIKEKKGRVHEGYLFELEGVRNQLDKQMKEGKYHPDKFIAQLASLKNELAETKPNFLLATKIKRDAAKHHGSVNARAPEIRNVTAPTSVAVQAPTSTLTGAMLSKRTSGDAASEKKQEYSETDDFAESVAKMTGLAVLAESGPPAFEIKLNDLAGDFQNILKEAITAASETGATVIEFQDQCVIKTEDACVHLSKAEDGQTKLNVRSQSDKQDKAFEDAVKVVPALGDMEAHQKNSLQDHTAQQDVQGKIEQLSAQRDARLEY
ncbi:MAG: hypothetical protein K2X50_07825 [Gammaproteobacteria bacterium]|nr:hypothetical protein [Gammaproteobacteria bacterium]